MSATAKQKKPPAVITRTTARDTLIRYPLGLALLTAGLALMCALLSASNGIAFRGLRELAGGLSGSLPWPLPVLMVWTGGLMMLSCYHRVNWRSCLFAWAVYLSVLALMAMLTFVGPDRKPLIRYVWDFNEMRTDRAPRSFLSTLTRFYEWGLSGDAQHRAGGALGTLLGYPFFSLFGHVLGTALLIALTLGALLCMLQVRVGALIRSLSDRTEARRFRRAQDAQQTADSRAAAPANAPAAAPVQQSSAAYTYDTYTEEDQPAYPGYTDEDFRRPGQPAREPAAGWDGGFAPQPAQDPQDRRFVPVGDGNTLYSEDFVLHPPEKKEKKEKKTSGKKAAGKESASSETFAQPGPDADDGTAPVYARPTPAQMPDGGALDADAGPVSPQARPSAEPTQALHGGAAEPDGPLSDDMFMPPPEKRAARKEQLSAGRAKPAPAPAKKEEPPAARPAQEEKAPWEEEDGEELSEWQKQLREIAGKLPGAKKAGDQPVRKDARPVVQDVEPAVRMDKPVAVPSRTARDSAEDAAAAKRLDHTPAPAPVQRTPQFSQPYTPPPINFLSEPKLVSRDESVQEDTRRAQQIERTLSTFNIQTQVREITHGPAITRFALRIAEGVKVKQVVGVLDNIALEMGSDRLRIEAPIPGTSYIGIEVPNSKVSPVTLREVLDSEDMRANPSPLVVALGKDIAGKPILCDLSRMPHLLIAGATGSGKSVCINSIVCSLLYRASPADVRLIMVDPKQVELQVYNGIPHLLNPVISDPKKAATALSWVVNEMFDRYGMFSSMGVRNLAGYNKKVPEKKLPNIVVIIDEMADLMEVCRKDVEESVRRLAALARAAGIYMVLATQRPSVDVITGVIKNNIPSRIAFTVSSGVDSRTIIDINGAEKLMGKGDMLYQPTGASKPTRVQGCFVSDEEVARITENIVARYPANYSDAIRAQMDQPDDPAPQKGGVGDDARAEVREGEFNDLLAEAVRMAVEDGQTSISMLQRTLRIGYARAGRLVDEMTKKGLISEAEGSKPRKVLITREQFLAWLQENQQQAG